MHSYLPFAGCSVKEFSYTSCCILCFIEDFLLIGNFLQPWAMVGALIVYMHKDMSTIYLELFGDEIVPLKQSF